MTPLAVATHSLTMHSLHGHRDRMLYPTNVVRAPEVLVLHTEVAGLPLPFKSVTHSFVTTCIHQKITTQLSTEKPMRNSCKRTHHGVLRAPWREVGVSSLGCVAPGHHRNIGARRKNASFFILTPFFEPREPLSER